MRNFKSLFKQMFILYETIIMEEKLKPAKNDKIWLVLVLYRCFIRRPPVSDNHFRVVPSVVLYRCDQRQSTDHSSSTRIEAFVYNLRP